MAGEGRFPSLGCSFLVLGAGLAMGFLGLVEGEYSKKETKRLYHIAQEYSAVDEHWSWGEQRRFLEDIGMDKESLAQGENISYEPESSRIYVQKGEEKEYLGEVKRGRLVKFINDRGGEEVDKAELFYRDNHPESSEIFDY